MTNMITKTITTKKGTTTKEFNIDASFVPTSRDEICIEFIINFCKIDDERKAWLKATDAQTITDAKGRVRPLPYMSLLAAFVEKYFSNLKPQTKGESYHALIAAL